MTKENILEVLSGIIHPAKDKSIVDLGMVEDVKIEENKIKFKLVFTGPDALSGSIKKSCEKALLEKFPEVSRVVIMELVRERKIEKRVGLELGLEQIESVSHIIAVASGKGGVGKSTVSVNLAVALAKAGYRVGLADADVYGPSVPKMTGTEDFIPTVDDSSGKEIIVPAEKFGVKWMSIGYFAKPDQPLIWRGPMACNALKQMILQVKWGPLDFLLIDMPPGTGDIHISLVQEIPMEGAVIVTTPQPVALADVEKGVNMFRNKNINRTIFGLVENMSWFTPAELPDNKYYIFGKNGGVEMAEQFGIPLLGQIPIVQSIREDGDNGEPAALSSRPDGVAFVELAGRLAKAVSLQ